MDAVLEALVAIRLWWVWRYVLATLLIAAVTGLRFLLADTLTGYPYLLYFPVIIICGVVLDRGSSLYATFLCGFLAVYLFVEPYNRFVLPTTEDSVAFLLFVATSIVMSAIIEIMRLGVEKLAASHAETRKALEERALLLCELGHRVKNDFQAVSLLLRIQSVQSTHPLTKEALEEAAERVTIMGRVHTRLAYQDHAARINLEAFLRELVADFEATRIGGRAVALDVNVTDIPVEQKRAIYLGLIVNELLTNALKYAFPNERIGRIAVTFETDGDHLRLEVADNGVGPVPGITGSSGQGTGLVQSLVQMLGGTVEIHAEHGMSCTVRIPTQP